MRHRTFGGTWKCTAAIAVTVALAATGCGTTREGGAAAGAVEGGPVTGLSILVPNSPGSGYDTTARVAAKAMEDAELARNIEVFNLEGAGGTVVDTPGDFFLSLMPTVPVAVACAVAIQRELGERNRNCEEDYRAVYRIGIGLGDLYQHGDDVLGEAINIAARLQALGYASRAAHRDLGRE